MIVKKKRKQEVKVLYLPVTKMTVLIWFLLTGAIWVPLTAEYVRKHPFKAMVMLNKVNRKADEVFPVAKVVRDKLSWAKDVMSEFKI